MDDQDLADLAREYGLDPRDYSLDHNQYSQGYEDTSVADYPQSPDYGSYAEYDEIEDYTEDPGNVPNHSRYKFGRILTLTKDCGHLRAPLHVRQTFSVEVLRTALGGEHSPVARAHALTLAVVSKGLETVAMLLYNVPLITWHMHMPSNGVSGCPPKPKYVISDCLGGSWGACELCRAPEAAPSGPATCIQGNSYTVRR